MPVNGKRRSRALLTVSIVVAVFLLGITAGYHLFRVRLAYRQRGTAWLPYPNEARRQALWEAFSACEMHDWKSVVQQVTPVEKTTDATPTERSCAAVLHWYAEERLNNRDGARQSLARFQTASRSLSPHHELRRIFYMFQALVADRGPTIAENDAYGAVRGDLSISAPTPGDVYDEDTAMLWVRQSIAQEAYRTAIAHASHLLKDLPTIKKINPVYKAQALYYSTFAYIKLDDRDQAEKTIREFDTLSAAYPDATVEDANLYGFRMNEVTADMRTLEKTFALAVTTPTPHHLRAIYKPSATDGWKIQSLSSINFSSTQRKAVHDLGLLFEQSSADAGLVIYRGKIIYEWYSPRYTPPFGVASASKTWIALLTGMLIADGKIQSEDDLVSKYLSEWHGGKRDSVRLCDLLSQTSGIDDQAQATGIDAAPSMPLALTADSPGVLSHVYPQHDPGKQWAYSNAGVQLLAMALEKAAGSSLSEYARQRLFLPLGMRDTSLPIDSRGNTYGFGGGRTTARDLARLGQLMMQEGQWEGHEIVPRAWIHKMLKASPQSASLSQHSPGMPLTRYGYLTWLTTEPTSFSMEGDLDNLCFCFPEKDVIVVRMQQDMDILSQRSFTTDMWDIVPRLFPRP